VLALSKTEEEAAQPRFSSSIICQVE